MAAKDKVKKIPAHIMQKMSTKRLVAYLRSLRSKESFLLKNVGPDVYSGADANEVEANKHYLVSLTTFIAEVKEVLAKRGDVLS